MMKCVERKGKGAGQVAEHDNEFVEPDPKDGQK